MTDLCRICQRPLDDHWLGLCPDGSRVIDGDLVDWMPVPEDDEGRIGVWMDDGGNPIGTVSAGIGEHEGQFLCEAFFGAGRFSAWTYSFDEAVEALYRNAVSHAMSVQCIHDDDVARGAIRVNAERWQGRYCCLTPDPDVVGRWTTIAAFRSLEQAEAFAAGYVAHRDGRGPRKWAPADA